MARPEVSALTEEVYEAMAPFAQLDEATDYALLKYIDAWAKPMLGDLYEIVRDTDDRLGWTVLFDPDEAPVRGLPYLAQFPGATLTPEMDEAERRAEIKAPSGWQRGRPAAMVQAVQRTLTGSKLVILEERFTGDAYLLWVRTLVGETPDPDLTEQAVLSQKPIGIVLEYEAVTGISWADLVADYTDWAEVEAAFSTWYEVVLTEPS